MILTSSHLTAEEFERATGWVIKPQGACKGEHCVPLGGIDGFDLPAIADRLGMPLLRNDAHGLTALGPASVTGRALETATAPDLTLPDWKGGEFRLSSLRGQKIFLLAWASW